MMNRLSIHPGLWIGACMAGLVALAAAISLLWTPYDPVTLNILQRLKPPSATHWFGTDAFGRDVASMIMAGARNSLGTALGAVLLGLTIGLPAGLSSALARGGVESGLMRATDLVFAFPAILSAAVIAANLGPGAMTVVLAVGLFNAAVFARVARGAALQVMGKPFVLAARAMGRGPIALAWQHVLPNIAAVLIVQATVQLAIAVLAEASLSYIGFGLQPPIPSLGRMLAESQTRLSQAPWLALFPGGTIALTVLGLNLLGDGLRDWIDPRLRPFRVAG